VRSAIRDALGSPSWWLVAAAGFLARGGILILALPVLSLPTPVGVTLLVPPLSVTTSGVSSAFVPQLIALGAAILVVVVIALLLGALSDAVSFRMMADRSEAARVRSATCGHPAADTDAARPGAADPVSERGGVHAGLLARLVATELFALLPAIAAGLVTVSRLVSVGEQEFLLPTSVDVPYPVRVVQGAAEPVVALAACLLLADVANALISRRVLRRDERRRGPDAAISAASDASGGPDASLPGSRKHAGPALRRVRRDLLAFVRIGATWAGAWIVTLASVVPGVIAIELAWPALRDAYTATMSRTPPSAEALVVATVVFVVAWVAALLVAGLGSAIRTILWSFATAP
jgi:hypothetical protein